MEQVKETKPMRKGQKHCWKCQGTGHVGEIYANGVCFACGGKETFQALGYKVESKEVHGELVTLYYNETSKTLYIYEGTKVYSASFALASLENIQTEEEAKAKFNQWFLGEETLAYIQTENNTFAASYNHFTNTLTIEEVTTRKTALTFDNMTKEKAQAKASKLEEKAQAIESMYMEQA